MKLHIPFIPVQVDLQRRSLKPIRLKLWMLMSLVMMTAVMIASGVAVYRRREPRPVKATSSNPAIAVRQEVAVHGIRWGMSYDAALEQAKAEGSPVLIYFASLDSPHDRLMEQQILPHSDVTPWLSQYVTVQLYVDRVPISSISSSEQEDLAQANIEHQLKLTGKAITPCFVVLSPHGEVVATVQGFQSRPSLAAFLNQALIRSLKRSNYPDSRKR